MLITQIRRVRDVDIPFSVPAEQLEIASAGHPLEPLHKMDNPSPVHPLLTNDLLDPVNPPPGHPSRPVPKMHPNPAREHPRLPNLQTFRKTTLKDKIRVVFLSRDRPSELRDSLPHRQDHPDGEEDGRLYQFARD